MHDPNISPAGSTGQFAWLRIALSLLNLLGAGFIMFAYGMDIWNDYATYQFEHQLGVSPAQPSVWDRNWLPFLVGLAALVIAAVCCIRCSVLWAIVGTLLSLSIAFNLAARS